jgi:Ca-activated chloride channel homolog
MGHLRARLLSARNVHHKDDVCRGTRPGVKFLDGLGMKYMGRAASYLAIFLLATLPVRAQVYAPPVNNLVANASASLNQPDDSLLTITKRVDEVNVLFIATDKHGKFVRNLNQADFSILDDHMPPESIIGFRSDTDLPIEMGLLVDTSGSVRQRFAFEQDAAEGFLEHVIRPHFDKAFVEGFNSHAQLTQDFTDSQVLLSVGIRHMHDGGGTALFDAIYHACKDKFKDLPDHAVRRALIIVSDGEDNQSEFSEAQAIEAAQRAQVTIYTISTDDSGLVLRGDQVMQQIADATGGRAFLPYKIKDITHSFSAIEDELRSQYVVSYHPADFNADGKFRSIQITALKKDLQVRARRGYYAPRP